MKYKVVCCSEIRDPNWKWIAPSIPEMSVYFVSCSHKNAKPRVTFLNLKRVSASLEAVRLAKRIQADVLVAHGPTIAAWCAIFGYCFSLKSKIVGHTFNFSALPNSFKTVVF